jgi:hypothetical protein
MTSDGETPAPGTVTALRRPPVRQSIVVRSGRRHTFDTFGCLAAMTGGQS